jgi:hypothetical protein
MCARLDLPALIGSHPLAALASFGLLRVVSEQDHKARLGFEMLDDWQAYLQSDAIEDRSSLVDVLNTWLRSDALESAIRWAEDVRVPPEEFQRILSSAIESDNRVLVEFLTALAADGAVDGQKGRIKPSAFYMVSGQQSFLQRLRDIREYAVKMPKEVFEEALFGPWRYSAKFHSLGWDPNTERLHAYRHRAPTSEDPSCVPGAVLLAFWALPLMPTVSLERRAHTVGFARSGRQQSFLWPVVSSPVGIGELKSLLQVGVRGWFRDRTTRRTGIAAVFRSVRGEFGQGYAVLRPAREVVVVD